MFRKIVSNLAFSPSLVGKLTAYSRYLKKEGRKRLFGLIFMLLAVITQLLIALAPPESSNALPPANTMKIDESQIDIKSKTAFNITQAKDADSVTALPGDIIQYNLRIDNRSDKTITAKFADNISDVLEYAELINFSEASLDSMTNVLEWPSQNISAHSYRIESFSVRLKEQIPAIAQGKFNKLSYNCQLNNSFGNDINIAVSCPAVKIVESTSSTLPPTGASTNLIFAFIGLITFAYYYIYNVQLQKESMIIRNNVSSGVI